jgi:hypothetical protein
LETGALVDPVAALTTEDLQLWWPEEISSGVLMARRGV